MSPLEIRIMLHYHYSPLDWTEGACDDTFASFVQLGLLERRNAQHQARYALTPRGLAYVTFLMDVPVPERKEIWSVNINGNHCPIEL